jgi:hypothetical protein
VTFAAINQHGRFPPAHLAGPRPVQGETLARGVFDRNDKADLLGEPRAHRHRVGGPDAQRWLGRQGLRVEGDHQPSQPAFARLRAAPGSGAASLRVPQCAVPATAWGTSFRLAELAGTSLLAPRENGNRVITLGRQGDVTHVPTLLTRRMVVLPGGAG